MTFLLISLLTFNIHTCEKRIKMVYVSLSSLLRFPILVSAVFLPHDIIKKSGIWDFVFDKLKISFFYESVKEKKEAQLHRRFLAFIFCRYLRKKLRRWKALQTIRILSPCHKFHRKKLFFEKWYRQRFCTHT